MPIQQQIRSEEVQDILTKVPHWMIQWGNTVILIMLFVFLAFTWFIRYPDIIAADATVTSHTPPQKEFAKVTGKIDTILVTDNQKVQHGQVLAMLENTALFSDVFHLKSVLDTLTISNDSFYYPVDKMPILALGDISSTYVIFEKDYINYTLNKVLNPYSDKITANYLSESELQLRLKSLQNQKLIDEKKFELSKNEFKRNEQLYDKGVISLNEFEKKQLNYLEDEKRLQNIEISLSQLKQALNDAHKNSKETKINNQMEDTRLFKNLVQSFTQLQEAIKVWENKYIIKSNIDGIVSFINVWKKHQNISQGDLLFTIIPDDSNQYLAKIKAPIKNSGKIKKGQQVNIKLLNFPETEYGTLSGTIENMSALPNQEGFYLINVALKDKLITSYNIEIPFKNEMTGSAEIITEDLRLMERLFYQLRGIFGG